jgi:hypothetical protein
MGKEGVGDVRPGPGGSITERLCKDSAPDLTGAASAMLEIVD